MPSWQPVSMCSAKTKIVELAIFNLFSQVEPFVVIFQKDRGLQHLQRLVVCV